MTTTALLLVFFSVFLHAGWNVISKTNRPSGAFYLLASATSSLILFFFYIGSGVDFFSLGADFWLLFAGSVIFEVLYLLGLAYAYRVGDISVVYPLGRALPVLMVALITVSCGIGTTPTVAALVGMLVVCVGCVLLPLESFRRMTLEAYRNRAFLYVVLIAVGTTGYTIIDSIAMRLLRSQFAVGKLALPMAYLFFIETGIVISLAIYILFVAEERKEIKRIFLKTPYPMLTGVSSSCAYGLILLAMQYVSNVSYIQVFRQMSLPLGVLAGILILKENPSLPKITGMLLILAGLVIVFI